MSAEPAARQPLSPQPDGAPRSEMPRAIREALLPEEAGQFDSEWRTAMSRSAESLDLAEVYTVLDRWRGIAALTQADPQAHRRMLPRDWPKPTSSLAGTPPTTLKLSPRSEWPTAAARYA